MGNSNEQVVRLKRNELFGAQYKELVEALFGNTQIDDRLKYCQWLFEKNSASQFNEELPIYIFLLNSKMVGQLGVIPVDLVFNGKEVRGGWAVDFYVRPEGQRRGIGKKLLLSAHKDFPLLMTLGQTDASFGLFIKCSWHHCDSLIIYKKLLNPIHSLPKMALKKIGFHIDRDENNSRKFKLAKNIDAEVKYLHSLNEIQKVCDFETIRGNTNTYIRRSSDFITWRYFQNPFVKYNIQHVCVKRKNNLIFIWRMLRDSSWEKAILVDILYEKNTPVNIMQKALKLLIKNAESKGVEIFECQTSDPIVLEALPRGFLTTKQTGERFLYGMVDMGKCPLTPTKQWGLFSGDCDVEALSTRNVK